MGGKKGRGRIHNAPLEGVRRRTCFGKNLRTNWNIYKMCDKYWCTNPNFVMVFSWKWCVFQEYLFKNILRRCLVFGVTSLYYFLCFLFVSERKVNFKATSSKRNRFVPAFLSREWVMGKQKFAVCNLISTISKE